MKKHLHLLLGIVMILISVNQSHGQSKLIHYWHFNNYTSVAGYLGLPSAPAAINVTSAAPYSVHADYSRIDTSKAKIVYMTSAGTSASFTTTIDYVIPGDTINARLGHALDTSIISYGLRPRNRSDSMELRWYIPTTHYKNIVIKYESQSSSVTSGPLHQVFDYSVDSGTTWKTSGLSVASDSAGLAFGPVFPVSFTTDTTVNNNPKLVFRIKFVGNSSGTSGNNRFDNITVEGDTITGSTGGGGTPVLVHYWHFNNLSGAWHNTATTSIPAFKADWSAIDTNKTALAYKLVPGTSATYAGYVDNFTVTAADSDVYNLRTIGSTVTPAGNVYRLRNPTDSAYLLFYMPSTGYKNLVLTYDVESSSTTSGYHINNWSYSTDSGATWKTVGMDQTVINSISVDTLPQCVFKPVVINFTSADTTVNNNPRLVLKMVPGGANTLLTSGNNRFDNFTLDGVPLHPGAVSPVTANVGNCTLYPNPANTAVYINTPAEGSKIIMIYNTMGQRVFIDESKEKLVQVNISNFPTGMYIVNVRMEDGTSYTMRLTKN